MQILKKLLALIIVIVFIVLLICPYIKGLLQIIALILTTLVTIIVFIIQSGLGAEILRIFLGKSKEKKEKPRLAIVYDNEERVYSSIISKKTRDGTKICDQKPIMILVTNSGGIARNCKAELKVINSSFNGIKPTKKPKFLSWYISSNHSLQKDIASNGEEYLYVVFSDSRLKDLPDNDIYAFVYTFDILDPIIQEPRGEYGFGIGDFEIKIIVKSEDGAKAESQFFLHVDKDFKKLGMKRYQKRLKWQSIKK